MSIFKQTIFTGFTPNLTGRDVLTALSYLFLPWRWPKILSGRYPEEAEKKLCAYFNLNHACVFDSGRSALYYGLKALGAGEGDEVLLQAYTCVVVVNAIKFTGAKPVFIDVDHNFNMDSASLEKQISLKSKIVIIQHTFGLPANLDRLIEIAKKHNLKIIEDCAHSLGARYQGKLTGTFGDLGMLSFGSDKIISCGRGGALITADDEIANKIKKISSQLPRPRLITTLQHLTHFPIFFIAKPIYHIFIGKIILTLAKKLNVYNKIIYQNEKKGEPVSFYPAKLANSLAHILCRQIDEIDKLNAHRRGLATIYQEKINNPRVSLPWLDNKINLQSNACLRYPLLTGNPAEFLAYAKKHGIILGDWYNQVIAPKDVNLFKTGYPAGQCPNAERLSSQSVNLPTGRQVTKWRVNNIVEVINSYGNKN